ncbi:MAG: CPBP family intramembrane glutamic endopeptidase [Paracoccaceae bacterium]
MIYRSLDRFTAPAVRHAELWRSALGAGAIAVIYLGGTWIALFAVAQMTTPMQFVSILRQIGAGNTPAGLAMLLASFIPMALGVAFVTRGLHQRALGSLLGAQVLRDFRKVLIPLAALWLALLPLALLNPDVGRSTPLPTVLTWLPLVLPLLVLQIGAEELVFRGYLLQQLGARFHHPLIWMGLPSVLFGALHYNPADFGANAIWPALWAGLFGCLAADLTARSGNLGAALAFHLATNFSGMVLVGLYGSLDGLALYTLVINPRDGAELAPYLAADFLSMLVSWLIARLVLRL